MSEVYLLIIMLTLNFFTMFLFLLYKYQFIKKNISFLAITTLFSDAMIEQIDDANIDQIVTIGKKYTNVLILFQITIILVIVILFIITDYKIIIFSYSDALMFTYLITHLFILLPYHLWVFKKLKEILLD